MAPYGMNPDLVKIIDGTPYSPSSTTDWDIKKATRQMETVRLPWEDGIERDTPKHFWHLTEWDRVESIMEQGLIPGRGELSVTFGDYRKFGPLNYLFPIELGAHIAVTEGFYLDTGPDTDYIALLRIDATQVKGIHQIPERVEWEHRTDQIIPSSAIEYVRTYDTSAVLSVVD